MAEWLSERSRNGGADRIPLPITSGQLWVCGKHYVGPDPEAALARTGTTAIICLNERHELADRYPEYVVWLRANSPRRALWFPVADLGAPAPAAAHVLVSDLCARLGDDERLLLHCGAGIGRAGTIAAAVLMSLGTALTEAVGVVAGHRPGAGPEAGAQTDLLAALAFG